MIVLCCFGAAGAQKGTAPGGFYTSDYHGDTWTGEVTAADDAKREMTLTYRKGNKVQEFTCVLPEGVLVKMRQRDDSDGTLYTIMKKDGFDKNGKKFEQEVYLTKLIGLHVTVFYVEKEEKENGQKVKFNKVVQFVVLPEKGKK
jgi:hypothetical protein